MPSVFSVFIVVVIIVDGFFFDDVQLNRIKTNDFQLNSTFFTINHVALVRIGIYVDVGVAVRTRSGRHFFYLQ